MDIQLRTIAETAAHLLLQSFREEHPDWQEDCTPLDAIVPWLGLYVETFHAEDYPPGTYGFTDADEDEHLIWLRRDLSENFRRFTLAHELGHALLHCRSTQRIKALLGQMEAPMPTNVEEPSRDDPCNETDVQENMTGLLVPSGKIKYALYYTSFLLRDLKLRRGRVIIENGILLIKCH